MLHALVVSNGSLPRKSWDTLVVLAEDKYHLICKKVAPMMDSYGVCHVDYGSPRDRGQFSMPDVCIACYPVLGEMTYCLFGVNKIFFCFFCFLCLKRHNYDRYG